MKKPWKQALAGLMVALMVLGVIPVNPYSADGKVLRAKAEATTYTFDPAVEIADVEKKGSVAAGKYADYFTITGSNTRGNSSTYSVELAKGEAGAISFTVTGTADVTIEATSTGVSNESAMALKDEDGNKKVPDGKDNAVVAVTGTDPVTTVTYTGLETGTYSIVSDSSNTSRGVRILKVVVDETAAAASTTTTEHTFDPAVEIADVEKKGSVAAGEYADYFTISGSNTRGNSGTYSVELAKGEAGAISFTVTGTADVTIQATSTGNNNESAMALKDEDGNKKVPDGKDNAVVTVTGTDPVTTVTYTGLGAGTYSIVSDSSNTSRGVRILKVVVDETTAAAAVSTTDHTFDPAVEITDVEKKGSVTAGEYADYFTISGSNTRGNSGTYSVELAKGEAGAISFTVTGTADVTIEATSTGNNNESAMALKDADGNKKVPDGTDNAVVSVTGTDPVTTVTYTGLGAGTYSIVSDSSNTSRGVRILKVVVSETTGGSKPARASWSSVAAPTLTAAALKSGSNTTIKVDFEGVIGYDGADSFTVEMTGAKGSTATKTYSDKGTSGSVEFTPAASDAYTFSIKASRKNEDDKAGANTKTCDFVLPLTAPSVSSATSQGNGVVMVKWGAVTEAEQYRVDVEGTDISVKTAELQAAISGLTVGSKYTFKVYALRGTDVSEAGEIQATATGESQQEWAFRRFGNGVDKSNNGYSGSANDGAVTVYSKGGKGKVVPASTDGLAFYYTTIDSNTTNFTLTATANVNNWTYSNGQEGFGLMAADRVGTDLDATPFWNNSYMASVTKVEYYWDASKQAVSDSGTKISMKLGIGSQQKIGVTKDNLAKFDANDTATINDNFSSTMTTLETSCAYQGAGTYNVIGNATAAVPGTVGNPLTKIKLTIQKNNTGYFVSYTDADGNKTTKKYYDTEALNKIDSDHVYVGFFASRNADVTFTDISFTTISKEDDAPAEETPITYVTPKYSFESSKNSNSRDYDLVYVGNADGQLVVTTEAGTELYNGSVVADQKLHIPTTLEYGKNIYYATMTPNADYYPSEYERLSSYEAVELTHTVTFEISNRNVVYVSPDGRSGGEGTKESPVDIYTAVKSPRAGQQIILMEGTYNLTSTVTVDRGINGTADEKIYMIADPEAKTRPVLDFNHACAGMVLAGNYWYFQGFDVTNSINGQKGIQVSGSNNVLDNLQTYRNGNTGIQISRYKSSDQKEDWPANNTILNCTSFLNADAGYEDADGFAAKLTIGEGNVFDGCVSAYNADDGWDLFAKVETGQIGKVVIKNSVAFKNGYVLDENGKQVNAGNGNGFKMGGDSITGYHSLENSIAFANKAKGIDSNSCPDIQVNMATSFDNQANNVAFYTNNAANTDFAATGIISYGKQYKNGENLKPKGSQDTSKYGGDTNYYYADGAYKNASGKQVEDGWFESLDTDAFLAAGVVKHEDGVYTIGNLSRNDDGTINMNGYLVLTSAAPTDAGARLSGAGTASENVAIEDDVIYVAKTSETIPDSVLTDAVKSVTGCTTVDELIIYIQKKLLEDAKGDDLFSGITVKDTVVWDVEVMISEDGGKTFSKATEANFPKNGVDVYLPYPTGTNGGYAFVVRHLITMAVNGQTVGEIENCPVLETTGDGICVHVMSASPFAIAWAPIPEDDDYVETTDSGNKGSELPLINHTATRVVVTSTMGEAKNAAGITGSDYLQVEIDVLQNDNQAVKLMKAFAAQNNLTLSGYFDINVYRMTANGVKAARLTNLQSPINLMLETPEGLDAKQYDFGVIRVHDGVAELLKDTDNDPITISVASDKFSPYAVVYAPKGSLASVKAGIATSSISKSGSKASPKTADESKFVPEIPETEVADFTQKQVEKQLQQEVTDLLITPQATPFPYGIVIVALVAMVAFIGGEVIFFRRRNQK